MPYIKQEDRKKWEKTIEDIVDLIKIIPENKREGELNYFISTILKGSYEANYSNYNKVMGLLECVKQEMYRKVIGPYEDKKRKENGDI